MAVADQYQWHRRRMVRTQIRRRGVDDPRVLAAMARVRRHRFVDDDQIDRAHDDGPLPIGSGQTISQPYIVALMVQAVAVDADARVLEVGTGSGYGAAVLACLAQRVWTIERHQVLAERARILLAAEGFDNVEVLVGDGATGLADLAPFDAIVVTAAAPKLPDALLHQLRPGARLVAPVGGVDQDQELVVVRRDRRTPGRFDHRSLGPVRFVPLVTDEATSG